MISTSLEWFERVAGAVMVKTMIDGAPIYTLECSGAVVPNDFAKQAIDMNLAEPRDAGLLDGATQSWFMRRTRGLEQLKRMWVEEASRGKR